MEKKAMFFIDDVIWVFRDITRQKPKSIFDIPYLAMLKKAYDDFGVKSQLNVFYRTCFWYGDDEFSLADMTDEYKAEFEAASDWLTFGFHSKEEWPDYPYVNADYELVDNNFKLIYNEVCRFAGEKSFSKCVIPHWIPMSKEGIKALRDNGVKCTYATHGDKGEWDGSQDSLPYGHSFRLMHNRKPETGLYIKNTYDKAIARALCSYNHIPDEEFEKIKGTKNFYEDKETGIKYIPSAEVVLNLVDLDKLPGALGKYTDREVLVIGDHEQYFHSDYYAYQPDHAERVYLMGKMLKEAGYTFVLANDLY